MRRCQGTPSTAALQCGFQSAPVARPVPGVRSVEHARRGARPRRAREAPPGAARRRRGARRTPARRRAERLVAAPAAGGGRSRRSKRMSTGIGELDRVLGGGLVPGSLVLLGGSPGIGKSTLTNMALGQPAEGRPPHAVCERRGVRRAGEAARRAARDRRPERPALSVPILAETDLDTILDTLAAEAPRGVRDRLGADAATPPTAPARRARSGRSARWPRRSWRWPRPGGWR